jgi:hypothetical protein
MASSQDPSMIILGLNAFHGDPAAALVRDVELIAAAEEERFRRVKALGWLLCAHAASSSERCSARWWTRQTGTVNSSLTHRPRVHAIV